MMRRFETEAAKQEAVDTLKLLMSKCESDESYRHYSKELTAVLNRPVAPNICAFGDCEDPVEDHRSYCYKHSSGSWVGNSNA